MNFFALLDKAKAKLKDNDPFFQENRVSIRYST